MMKIKKFCGAFALMLAVVLTSCGTAGSVAFKEADNYFTRNDYTWTGVVKLTTQGEFDSVFGMAAVMGEKGHPTAIDFAKEFVVARVFPVTNVDTRIGKKTLVKTGENQLRLDYELKEGEKMSSSMQPCFILVVDNKYRNCEITDGGRR